MFYFFFFSSRRRHTRLTCDWSSDVCSSDLGLARPGRRADRDPLEEPRAGPARVHERDQARRGQVRQPDRDPGAARGGGRGTAVAAAPDHPRYVSAAGRGAGRMSPRQLRAVAVGLGAVLLLWLASELLSKRSDRITASLGLTPVSDAAADR